MSRLKVLCFKSILVLISCVDLTKVLDFSMPHFLHLYKWDKSRTHFRKLLCDWIRYWISKPRTVPGTKQSINYYYYYYYMIIIIFPQP